MQTHASQDAASKTLSSGTTEGKTQGQAVIDGAIQTKDQRHEAGSMRQLQSRANHSPQALQLQDLQQIARQSPQANRLNTLQAMADGHAAQRVQNPFLSLQRQTSDAASGTTAATNTRPSNNNGLPAQLQAGIENLSGMSLGHVQVHYNSDKPAQLQAHAYAQGSDIHLAPGQEKHLPHEAWHVVQQAQGRVRPTLQMKQGVPVNDDIGLEQEADVMGARAMSVAAASVTAQRQSLDAQHAYSSAPRQDTVQSVAQLTKKDDIKKLGKGYDDTDAENLKIIAGGWVDAWKLAKETTRAFLGKVVATRLHRLVQRQILQALDEVHYDHLLGFVGNDVAELVKLVKKGAGTSLVRRMLGVQPPPLRALVVGMSDTPEFTDIGMLGFVCQHYPGFVAITTAQLGAPAALQEVISWLAKQKSAVLAILETVAPSFVALQAMVPALTNINSLPTILATYANFRAVANAQMIAAPARLQTVITHLSAHPNDVLVWLEANNPNFAVLEVLAAQNPDKALLGMLVNFAKEVAPGNDDYEAIGAQNNRYRIGHYALGHTLRGMLAVPALNGTKTLWPAATTLAQVRGVCLDFDQHNVTTPNTAQSFTYTPTVAPTTQIFAAKNFNTNDFDQLYPRTGTDISPDNATKLSAINAVKNNWTAIP